MKDGDILLYLDAGCEMPYENKEKLNILIEQVKTELLISSTNYQTEKRRSKRDLIRYLDCEDDKIIDSPQRQPGAVLYYVCKETRDFVNEWYEICCSKNYHWLDDTPSKIKNYPEFKGHRHDQSIFSLLSKKDKTKQKLYYWEDMGTDEDFKITQCGNFARGDKAKPLIDLDITKLKLFKYCV